MKYKGYTITKHTYDGEWCKGGRRLKTIIYVVEELKEIPILKHQFRSLKKAKESIDFLKGIV